MSRVKQGLVAAFMLLSASNGWAATETFRAQSCEYFSLDGPMVSGACSVSYPETNGGNFVTVLKWPSGKIVKIEYLDSQSGTHRWKINGEVGMGFEINRSHLKGSTLDLKQFVEWEFVTERRGRK